jgi:hypothetical protein
MTIIGWSRILMAGAGLITVGCSASGQQDQGSAPLTQLPAAVVTRAVAGVPCGATNARPRKALPAAFKPVAVVRCYSKARGVNGQGLWRFMVKQRADHHLATFIAAL